MKCVILSTLLVGAAAFAPAQTGKSSTALSADLTNAVGAQAPLGCFDPLGVLGDPKDGDQEQFDNLRYIELKHGRVAMLAFVGYIVTYVSVFRGDIFFRFDSNLICDLFVATIVVSCFRDRIPVVDRCFCIDQLSFNCASFADL